MNKNSNRISIFTLLFLALLQTTPTLYAGTYKQITNFGENPSNIKMFLYTPDKIADNPPILVACHWCHGTAQAMYNGSKYVSLADKNGYYVIFPEAISSDGCWDVASEKALTHNGGGDPQGIVSMVKYVIKNFNADPARVYVIGVSSGAMMTNLLLGAYPDVFAAGSAFAGVPFGCFAGPNSWNSACATGKITKTAKEWGDLVRAAYPGYSGKRPKIQLWHGTNDEVLNYHNFEEAVKQWTNVLGADPKPSSTETDIYKTGWIRNRYTNVKDEVVIETISEKGASHNLQVLQEKALSFLGLDNLTTGLRSENVPVMEISTHTQYTVSPMKSGKITLTVQSVPGSVSLSLYTINGTMMYKTSEIHSVSGLYIITLDKTMQQQELHTSKMCIVNISVNSEDVGAFRIPLQ